MATLNQICNNHKLPVSVVQTSKTKTIKKPFILLGRIRDGFEIVVNGVKGTISKSPLDDYEAIV